MANKALEAYRDAVKSNPEIVTTKDNVRNHPGNTEEQLEALGLTPRHLLRLSRMGLALKGYTQNIYPPKEDEKDAWAEVPVVYTDDFVDDRGYERTQKRVEVEKRPRYWYRGKGMRTRWILFQE